MIEVQSPGVTTRTHEPGAAQNIRFSSLACGKAGRWLVGAVSAGVLVSALVYGIASLVLSSDVPWIQFAFEPVVIGACVIGILFACGKFRWAPAMTIFCVAGTIAVASPLVYRGMLGHVQIAGQDRGWSLMPWLAGRMLGACVLTVLAAMEVIARDSRAKKSVVNGVIATLPLLIAGAVFVVVWHMKVDFHAMPPTVTASAPTSIPDWAATGLLGLLGITAGVSICASGHYFIRALEIGSDVAEGRAIPDGTKS